jgi:Zn-dependent protease with chaperone function
MERESLLTVLTIMLGGVALQLIGAWLSTCSQRKPGCELERAAWLRLWRPLTPAVVVAAWLCGWALSQPDPVPHRVGPLVFIVCAPFALIGMRALLRAGWSLLGSPEQFGIATVGLIRPHIVFAPQLARLLDERAIEAALAHERAHVRHLDPLRIWIAQFVTDLQWPWSSAQRRFETWLAALEHARDDEARAEGIEGADLAAALVASIRFHRNVAHGTCARLIGDRSSALEERVERLLQPLASSPRDRTPTTPQILFLLTLALIAALALGTVYGERFVGILLAFS